MIAHSRRNLGLMRFALAVLLIFAFFQHSATAQTSASGDDRAFAIWETDQEYKGTILINAAEGPGQPGKGTGFLISQDYALTAKHVVCSDGQERDGMTITFASGTTISQVNVNCDFPNDIALIQLPGSPTPRAFLPLGSELDVLADSEKFISLFTYAGSADGAFLSGKVTVPQTDDQFGYMEAAVPNQGGDSGAPIVDCRGNVVAVNVAGNGGIEQAIPLSSIDPRLYADAGVAPPTPLADPSCPTVEELAHPNNTKPMAIFGQVWLNEVRTPGAPPEILMPANEMQLDVEINDDPMQQVSLAANSSYTIPLSSGDQGDLSKITVRPEIASSATNLVAKPLGFSLAAPIDGKFFVQPHDIYIYQRGRLAADDVIAAQDSFNPSLLPACFQTANGVVTSYVDCADQNSTDPTLSSIYAAESDYKEALTFTDDTSLRAEIVSRLLSLATQAGRPCDAADTVVGLYSDNTEVNKYQEISKLGPQTFSYLLDDILGCQYAVINHESQSIMSWREPTESAQEAAAGLIAALLTASLQNPQIRLQHTKIIQTAVSSLETYQPNNITTPVQTSVAALDIFQSPHLMKAMTDIVSWSRPSCPGLPKRINSEQAVLHGLSSMENCSS